MIILLPSRTHIYIVFFFIGLSLYLFQVHPLPAFLSISFSGLGVRVYFLSIAISAIDYFSSFRPMYCRALDVLYRRLYPHPITLFAWSTLLVTEPTGFPQESCHSRFPSWNLALSSSTSGHA